MPASQLASSSPLRYTARSIGVEAQIDGAESDYIMTGLPEHEDGSGQGMTVQCMVAEPDGGTAETRDGQLLRVDRVGLVGLPSGPDGPALVRGLSAALVDLAARHGTLVGDVHDRFPGHLVNAGDKATALRAAWRQALNDGGWNRPIRPIFANCVDHRTCVG